MGQILDSNELEQIPELKKSDKIIILVGGCFDILHAGHIEFLEKAKEVGDILVILLESDKRIREIKGKGRPINSESDRAAVLSHLSMVDYVITAGTLKINRDYEALVKKIEPDIIAVTEEDRVFDWEEKYMEESGSKIIRVMKKKENYSTSKIIEKLKK